MPSTPPSIPPSEGLNSKLSFFPSLLPPSVSSLFPSPAPSVVSSASSSLRPSSFRSTSRPTSTLSPSFSSFPSLGPPSLSAPASSAPLTSKLSTSPSRSLLLTIQPSVSSSSSPSSSLALPPSTQTTTSPTSSSSVSHLSSPTTKPSSAGAPSFQSASPSNTVLSLNINENGSSQSSSNVNLIASLVSIAGIALLAGLIVLFCFTRRAIPIPKLTQVENMVGGGSGGAASGLGQVVLPPDTDLHWSIDANAEPLHHVRLSASDFIVI